MNSQFSFIIITYNEEIHLPRLLNSIADLDAATFIVDSGSTDNTIAIAEKYGATILQHAFENHPRQWDFALKSFEIKTPWVICLDADQIVTAALKQRLANFRDEEHKNINGIYFNRKNFFKGKWIKHGGYSPIYLLKMIRYGIGFSDLNENMDHRFIVPGQIEVWKDGFILEENLKENNISFWISKHNRYSDLVAREEVERLMSLRTQTLKPHFWGSPDERTAWLKQLWWKMPRYLRPMIYFVHRMFFQLGILDGRTGVIFHFLQAFWFRLIVDVKIDEIIKEQQPVTETDYEPQSGPLKFVFYFIVLFAIFYYFNLFLFGITSPGHRYNAFLDHYINYIKSLRWILLQGSAGLLRILGYEVITNDYDLLVVGHGAIRVVYSCLGLGVISFFSAFVIAYPKKWKSKIIFLALGILSIELLNILRFILLALFGIGENGPVLDNHTAFNITIYIIIAITLYFWVKNEEAPDNA